MALSNGMRKIPFLAGVFLITLSLLIFQILQTRILSVIAWYYMAFFAISVAMLGMTVGAVWVYLRRERFQSAPLPVTLSNFALMTAVAMPASVIVQFCLITSLAFSLVTLVVVGLVVDRHGCALRIFRRCGQSGADTQPVPEGRGLRCRPSWRGIGMRSSDRYPECPRRADRCHCGRRHLRPVGVGFCCER